MTPVEFILQNRPYFEDFITRSVYHSKCLKQHLILCGNLADYLE